MSVLIKGMKMPKGCHAGCPLTDRDAFTCEITGRDIVWDDEDTLTCRPSWCPLVEVSTPHGSLIDADALVYSRVRIAHEDGTVGGYNAVVMSSEIKNAPTVIEAEE